MLSNRVKNLKPSPTLALAAQAKELKAAGKDVISLSVGEPDWDTLASIKKAGIAAINAGATKYTPSNGIPELRQAICEQTNSDLNLKYTAADVTVTAGGKFVIFSLFQTILNPGDEVIIPAPYWVSYPTQVELAEAHPVIVECGRDTNYKLNAELLEKSITNKTKLLVLNSPSNPTGFMYSLEELKELAKVLKKFPQVLVMSDDIYNRLVFNDEGLAPHILMADPSLNDRVIIVNGASKTYSMTGWRLGWALGPKEIVNGMSRYQSQSVSCASGFTQLATVAALKEAQDEFVTSLQELKRRRDFVVGKISELPHVNLLTPDGAFYVWPDFSYYLGRSWKGRPLTTSSDLAAAILESQMVVAVPGIEFGLDGYLRLSYALQPERMSEAIERIKTFLSEVE